jgi:NAD(P)-dependent dehydrogenase (short-subunit alcohol dehydrogenase family)
MTGSGFSLPGRTALVTGSSGGLGVHFARVLAGAGAKIVLAARRLDRVEALRDELVAQGSACLAVELDLLDQASIARLAPAIEEIDILVNNAGIARPGMALNQSDADWDAVIDTNLKGLFFVSQLAAKAMRQHKRGGTIINIASITGIRQGVGLLPYNVSKAGVIQLTKTMALELARYGIRVNAIAPGSFPTEINAAFWSSDEGQAAVRRIPQQRLGRMDDLDGPLLLLASDRSAYMTGTVLVVDGGHLVSGL